MAAQASWHAARPARAPEGLCSALQGRVRLDEALAEQGGQVLALLPCHLRTQGSLQCMTGQGTAAAETHRQELAQVPTTGAEQGALHAALGHSSRQACCFMAQLG